jgi:glucitol operon activator protein
VQNTPFFVAAVVAVLLTAVSGFAQHKYYGRTVRRLAAHDEPGCVLVSGRARSRMRGAIAILVLRAQEGGAPDAQIRAAAVMEGATVFARFRERPDWVGLSATDALPGCSPRLAAAVADALTRIPGRPAPAPARRTRVDGMRGARPVGAARVGGRPVQARHTGPTPPGRSS